MKPVDVKSSTYIDFGKKIDEKDPKFKVCDHVKIWKHENCFQKGYVPIWFEEVFIIKRVKNTVLWTYVISDRFVSLVKFNYWSKFHLNIITGSGIWAIYFYNELTRNL